MKQINLLPPEYISSGRNKLTAYFFLFLCLVASVFIFFSRWESGTDRAIERSRAELASEGRNIPDLSLLEDKFSDETSQLNSVRRVCAGRKIYAQFTSDILSGLPPSVWFDPLDSFINGQNLSVTLTVYSFSEKDLRQWVDQLSSSSVYGDVKAEEPAGDNGVYKQSVSFEYKPQNIMAGGQC